MMEVLRAASADQTRLTDDQRAWYKGALGERHVARILQTLGPGWTVLHSVPVGSGDSDIDHVVIGPAGVFTINTKNHPGKTAWVAAHGMMIGGQKVPYIRNSAHEARRAEKVLTTASGLTVETVGVIVLVGAKSLTVKHAPDGGDAVVRVVRDRDLLSTIQTRRIYSDEQVQRIVLAAILPQTWHRRPIEPIEPIDTDHLIRDFDALATGVRKTDSKVHRRSSSRQLIKSVAITAGALITGWTLLNLLPALLP